MKKVLAVLCLFLVIVVLAFTSDSTYVVLIPKRWPAPEYNFRKHPLDKNIVALGRKLFYDPILSKDSTISCASCHSPYNAFTHVDHSLSHGIHDSIGTRNSPVLVNLAWNKRFMWDGAVSHLEQQARVPITHPAEMGESMSNLVFKLNRQTLYRSNFYTAFNTKEISEEQVLKALSQFMLTLVSANSRYDKVQAGKDTYSLKEQKGYVLFRKNCASCHTEPLFTNGKFENNGLAVDELLNDIGYMKVSKHSADSLKFKVPTLRNIEFSMPYMHDGRFKSLNEVLNHYSVGIQHSQSLSPALKNGIQLSSHEKVELISFLMTLSDKEFLFDKRYGFPMQ